MPRPTIQANLSTGIRDYSTFQKEVYTATTIDEVRGGRSPSLILLEGGHRSSLTEGDTIEMNWHLSTALSKREEMATGLRRKRDIPCRYG